MPDTRPRQGRHAAARRGAASAVAALVLGSGILGSGLLLARPCVISLPSPCSTLHQWLVFVVIVVGSSLTALAGVWLLLLIIRVVGEQRDERAGHVPDDPP